jgi:hypothetical protein
MKFFNKNNKEESRRGPYRNTKGHNNLNSSCKEIESLHPELEDTTMYSFDTTIGSSKGPTLSLRRLSQIQPTTITNWITQVRILFKANKYNNDEALTIL